MTKQGNTLQGLAKAYGIQLEWKDIWGNTYPVQNDVCRALLSAMEVNADSQADIDQAMAHLQHQTVARWLEPVMVVSEAEKGLAIPVDLPQNLLDKNFHWQLLAEDGGRWEGHVTTGAMDHLGTIELGKPEGRIERYMLRADDLPPQGYHRFILKETESGGEVDMLLVVTPTRCYLPPVLEAEDDGQNRSAKVWGPAVQLYAVNSRKNWGMGDFTDLYRIVDWCAEEGAAMVGLNPLHALFPHNPAHCSPYSPSSRIFFNVLYIDVEAVPDFTESEEARQLVFSPSFQNALEKLRQEELVNYAEAGRRKLEALELLYQSFCRRHLSSNTARGQEFKAYIAQQGQLLERFALFHALQERFHREDSNVWGWPVWPEAYRDPDSPAVKEFAEANRERIGFYQYLQWQTEAQLHKVGERCWHKNLGIGLYMDMAVGVDRGGADVWSNQHLFAKSSAVGCPPDEYNQKGQDWGLPPLIPEKMREEKYNSFIQILRQNMKFSGALRIDHVMALFRLFWIPPNMQPTKGAYVHYPVDELFGILALESQRNKCMVIGEDMGTVPPEIQERMERWGVFSYKVFYFEKAEDSFKPPEQYQDTAAVAISTHDLPTLAGFWEGRDIAIRTELDLYPSKELRDRQIKDRVMERVAILHLLEDHDLLPAGVTTDPASITEVTPEFVQAVHKLVAKTGSKVFMVQFEDMLLAKDQINLPGTTEPTYPNWRRRLSLPLEDLFSDTRVLAVSQALSEERPRWSVPGSEYQERLDAEESDRTAHMVPRATYRFQFNKVFTFRQAAELVPYLSRLGISHCYASPLLKARSGSAHGYDITNHKELNPEIGSREDFENLANTLKAHGMGLVLDIVPNHMGAGKDNPWWMDVLENGPSSMYADYFDIDWHPLAADLENKILLAILGDTYGKILENGDLKLRFEAETGRFWLDYYEHAVPINPNTYSTILSHRMEVLDARLGHNNTALFEYQSIVNALEHLPVEINGDLSKKEARMRERTIALQRLITLCQQTPEVRHFIEENVQDFQAGSGDTTSLNRLHRLLEQQAYRLSNWRVASDEINYRRFFDVNDLVAVRVEDPRVFNDTHDLIMDLVGKGQVTGLRIDHPDGLFDPAAYFQRLQQEAARRLNLPESQNWQLSSPSLPLYVLIEKILAPFERLPDDWTVHGTTGYEFCNSVNGLFVRQENERQFTRLYEKLIGRQIYFEDLVYDCKRLIMKTTLNSELGVLTYQLHKIAKKNWGFRDFTLQNLRSALMEVVACFPVYRAYVTPENIGRKDREYIDWAIRLAKRRSTATDITIFDFIRQTLLLEEIGSLVEDRTGGPETAPEATTGREAAQETSKILPESNKEAVDLRHAVIRFALKFQQYTGPVMAKGLEDTSFYRYNRLASLNDVGGDPQQFGISVNAFHMQNTERVRRAPHTLLATSTHDTKRSEDVRVRISVLSEMPSEWQKHLSVWRRLHRSYRKNLEYGHSAPSANDEYLFYQTLIGVWPMTPPDQQELENLTQRLEAYMLKAVREAKSHTSWINPNTEYEQALTDYIRGVLLKPSRAFLEDFVPFQKMVARFGIFNALSQTMLKITCPGVPDIYQGNELWDLSLVDPDNRRPVDYGRCWQILNEVEAVLNEKKPAAVLNALEDFADRMHEGHLKQYVISTVLRFRAQEPEVFRKGSYIPLEVTGLNAEHVVAFARQWEGVTTIVVVPRLSYTLGVRRNEMPCGKRIWKDTAIILPQALRGAEFENLLTRETVTPETKGSFQVLVSEILSDLPVGLLAHRAF